MDEIIKIAIMVVIPIGVLFLLSYLISRLYDSDLSAWFSGALVITITGIFITGVIFLEIFLHSLWFGAV